MSLPALDSPTALRVTRIFAASRERVFRAWSEPDALRKWFRVAEGYSTPIAEVDLRVGGRYRLGMLPPGAAAPQVVGGVYHEIAPPERLVFTWRWEGSPPDAPETLVTVEFFERGGHTEVVLTHEQFPDAPSRDLHTEGWQGCFNGLQAAITAQEV